MRSGALVGPKARPWRSFRRHRARTPLSRRSGQAGAVLVDQVRSIDRRARTLRWLGTVPAQTLAEARSKLAALIGIPVGDPPKENEPP
ncbi:type II toxin-antitoxin system PemK/MazF family toxin [Methylobacterium sp. J-078]|uniref:type II toxin-antitoxin system PemK/MazF family toxin n=1 Tax=Methylobacterium sp. J-078 TaxID=2836657 RepID=UPI001FBB04FD|nr:type II toxin-antitoxin system PemK/MazF family toxin [Methylobacterium sp. J-078]MCJ2045230.1 type II toxin-antitoxin system PemK/MazF family toxin [Methylobacterium sp. J-078]